MNVIKLGALACALSLGASAWAANDTLNVSLLSPLDTFADGYHIANRTVAAGDTFTDTYTFDLTQAVDIFGGVASPFSIFKGLTVKGLAFDSVTLSGAELVGERASSVTLPQFEFSNLAAGSLYVLTIKGHAVGSLGGSYQGDILSAAAVPEPETVALLIAGLAVVGTLSRRRQAA